MGSTNANGLGPNDGVDWGCCLLVEGSRRILVNISLAAAPAAAASV